MGKIGQLPEVFAAKITFLMQLFIDPYIVSAFASAFVASIFWMAAMTKFQISYAYPFMSLSFVLVLFLSAYLFGEAITFGKLLGLLFIITGLCITVKF
jgi:drug/metabolite transporter (DMT)-like permease